MKIKMDENKIRIIGNRRVDLLIYFNSSDKLDRFSLSLAYDGIEHGVLPMVEISGDKDIVVTNDMKTGRYLLNGNH